MSQVTKEDVMSFIENMTVLQLSEMVGDLEEKFGVSAAVAAAPVAAPPAEEIKVEEQTEFTVVLTNFGDKKIQVIKEIRAVTGLALKEAKDLVEAAPTPVKEGISKSDAEDLKSKLENVGASAEIK